MALRSLSALGCLCVIAGGFSMMTGGPIRAQQQQGLLLEIEGVINPVAERYLERGLEQAAEERRPLVVIRLDTPGGTMNAMRGMTRALLGAPVPTVVYVAPAGSHAASAGMFITAAAHVAAMAPGTNIGSAHPVTAGGGDIDEVMEAKVVNDAAALVRAIARERGRNADWLERAVRESVNATAEEALSLDIVDVVAPDLDTLLDRIDGRQVEVAGETVTLDTAALSLERTIMTLPERVLHALANPDIAYLLFTLGLLAIAVEIYSPGLILPGLLGGMSLILALVGFGSLPINWGGVVLVLVGLGLVIADLLTAGLGLLAAGGALAFLVGSLMLYRPFDAAPPSLPALTVSPWLIVAMTVLLGLFVFVVLRALLRARRAPVQTGAESLLGRVGVAVSDLRPRGAVRVGSETWSAVTEGEELLSGDVVRVVGVEGVTLRVRREGEEHAG